MNLLCVSLLVIVAVMTGALGCPSDFLGISSSCVKVVIAAGIGERPVSWKVAREGCKTLGTDLAVMNVSSKVEHLSAHIDEVFPKSSYSFWVGGHKINGQWKWVTDQTINLKSNLWVPNSPKKDHRITFALLVPDSVHRRWYLNENGDWASGYICEIF
ncbi:hypothetical protein OTU49_001598 [Cherax quadricarinatus]|uniref:C-type lectin domain-containing protein n=1 Tax=Cherax quadricarinatus TaxID=27406 RepID=A0AAW0XDQ3_CHEQU|nr:C-type lectin domain family 6 member A-like [Cherax quadricarinatus]